MARSIAIKNVLIELMESVLTEALTIDPSEEDEKAGLVRVGSLQDDPTINVQNILIREAGIDHNDELHDAERNEIFSQTWEIGGGGAAHFWRKFKVEFQLFYNPRKYDREKARTLAFVMQARAEHAIWNMQKAGVWPETADDFGETAHLVVVKESGINEGGGPPGDHIWRGEMMVEFMTEVHRDG